ncbi:MAG: acyl-CoA dehydrogenase family protein, partial [Chloroflexota bacterium]|nr:acyl-CoA dehydrogenase family protein [Chloroflexota bacterium]
MDYSLTEEQEMLKKSTRDFLEKECPKALVRELEKDTKGYSTELWRKMVDLGWMGLVIPEEYGGDGQSFLELAIVLEEMGRSVLPGPFFSMVVLGALPIIADGTEEQKREFLPGIAKGELLMTLALTEPDVTYDAEGVTVTATADKDDYIINGTKLFVFNAHIADWMLCVTRTKNGANPEEGITVFLVDAKTPGIEVTVLDTMGDDKQCEVLFNDVRVPKKNILGDLDRGWDVISKALEQATVAQCAVMIGQCIRVTEMTTEYAKTRVQFGAPIGVFQVTAHRSVDQ